MNAILNEFNLRYNIPPVTGGNFRALVPYNPTEADNRSVYNEMCKVFEFLKNNEHPYLIESMVQLGYINTQKIR